MRVAVAWLVCVCAAPPELRQDECALVSEPRPAVGVPANQVSPTQNYSSRTGALLPSGGPEHMPTSAAQRHAHHGRSITLYL